MGTQAPQLSDTLANLNSRVTALESTVINDSQPVDIYKSFFDTAVANDTFTIFTHLYHVCSTSLLCSTTLIL